MDSIALKFKSQSPLVMHSARLVDPTDPIAIALQHYHVKATLSPDDHAEVASLEFLGALWLKDERPCVPARTIETALREAAKRRNVATPVVQALTVKADSFIDYSGPPTAAELSRAPEFRLRTAVTVDGVRRMRSRPIFRDWSFVTTIHFNPKIVQRDFVVDCAIAAGDSIGIGAGRPRHGLFSVTPASGAT